MNIKELRTKEGLSQSALAKKLGIATSAIGHMENGRMKVSAKIADKAKAVFGVVLDTEAKVEKAAKSTAKKAEKAVKKAPAKAKAAAKKVEDKVVSDEIEAKKTAAKTSRKVKTAAKETAAKVEKAAKKPAVKAKAAKLTIEIQSPLGGSITPEEIAAKLPKDATNVYVRIDENKLYWVKKNGETGAVEIWD